MINKRNLAFVVIFAIIFFSCSNKDLKVISTSILHIEIPVNQLNQLKLSDIISEFKAVKLEFTQNSMIGSVRKTVIHNGLIYILDTFGAKSVLVFNMEGKFVRRIGSLGKGPGQYLSPDDFIIDTLKNQIEILGNRKINYFSVDGTYLRSINIGYTSSNFYKQDDKYFFAVYGKEDYKVYRTDLDGKIEVRYLPTFKDYESVSGFMCFIPQKSQLLLYRPIMRDTIYSFNDSHVVPFRIIDFGRYKFKLDEFKKLSFEEQMKFLKKNGNINQCLISNYFENTNYMHVRYNMSGNRYEYILNKNTGKYVHFGNENLTDDITWEKDSRWMIGGDEQFIYHIIETYKYKSTKQLRKFLESFTKDEDYIQEMLNETSNPILLLAKYKI